MSTPLDPSSPFGESLLVLRHVTRGLLNRTHFLFKFRTPELLNEDIDKITKKLAKRYPELPTEVSMTGIPGFPALKGRCVQVAAALEDFYGHFLNVLALRKR